MSGSSDDEFTKTPAEPTDENLETVAQVHYDYDEPHDLTTTIILAVAEAEGVDPTAIKSPRLHETIDVPALEETLFSDRTTSPPIDEDESVTFHYEDYRIRVQANGWVFVHAPADR